MFVLVNESHPYLGFSIDCAIRIFHHLNCENIEALVINCLYEIGILVFMQYHTILWDRKFTCAKVLISSVEDNWFFAIFLVFS